MRLGENAPDTLFPRMEGVPINISRVFVVTLLPGMNNLTWKLY